MQSSVELIKTQDVMWKWQVSDEPGLEHLRIEIHPAWVRADGFVIGIANAQPFRLHYQVECDADYQVQRVELLVDRDPSNRLNPVSHLHLVRDLTGAWADQKGKAYPSLAGCTEIDIQVSPFTNTLPIRRLALAVGQSAVIQVVYIALPMLELTVEKQRYTRLTDTGETHRYRYESLQTEFSAEIETDQDGLVVQYPDIFHRVW